MTEHDIAGSHAANVAELLDAVRALLRHPFRRRREPVERLRRAMAKVDGHETMPHPETPKPKQDDRP